MRKTKVGYWIGVAFGWARLVPGGRLEMVTWALWAFCLIESGSLGNCQHRFPSLGDICREWQTAYPQAVAAQKTTGHHSSLSILARSQEHWTDRETRCSADHSPSVNKAVVFHSIEECWYWQQGGKNGEFNKLATVDSRFISMSDVDGEKIETFTNSQLKVVYC